MLLLCPGEERFCLRNISTNPSSFLFVLGQFDCTNTLNDQLLETVTVQMEPSDAYDVICCIPAPGLAYNQPGICYTLVRVPQEDPTAGTPWEGARLLNR